MSHDAVFKRHTREGVTQQMTRASYWVQELIGDPFVGPQDAEEFAALAQEEIDRKHGAESRRAGQSKRVVPRPTPQPDVDPDDDDGGNDDDVAKPGQCPRCRMVNRPNAKSCKWCLSSLASAADASELTAASDYVEPLVLSREPDVR
jgi:hypothetical protein